MQNNKKKDKKMLYVLNTMGNWDVTKLKSYEKNTNQKRKPKTKSRKIKMNNGHRIDTIYRGTHKLLQKTISYLGGLGVLDRSRGPRFESYERVLITCIF
jgi:hypothetical protein